MKAVLCNEYCTANQLKAEAVAPLRAAKGQLVVTMKAAGVNFVELVVVLDL